MRKRIMLIGENKASFILDALRDALRKCGYEVDCAQPKINDIRAITATPDMILLYTGTYVKDTQSVTAHLRDLCTTHSTRIGLIGYMEEIDIVRKVISDNLIWRIFERPLNVKDMVDALSKTMENSSHENTKNHILVVDDSATTLAAIKNWLSKQYRISTANSAFMAISFLSTTRPDLILLDYEMPICSGALFLEMLRAESSVCDVPIIFLTSKGDKESVEKVLSLKPAGYLLKTMPPEKILEALEEFFEKNRLPV